MKTTTNKALTTSATIVRDRARARWEAACAATNTTPEWSGEYQGRLAWERQCEALYMGAQRQLEKIQRRARAA